MPRNSAGTYTLPSGNPVVAGTTIDASWANDTMSDLANEITNSLSRTGAGGMLAPFRVADGSVTAPGLGFTNETNTGLYRAGTGELWFTVGGVAVAQITANGLLIPSGKRISLPAPVNDADAANKEYVDDLVNPVIQYANYYLGPKSSDPSVNNSGGALTAGTTYWSTTLNQLRVYNGTTWEPMPSTASVQGQTFSGTGAQTAFTLAAPTGNATNLEVFISGVRQVPTTDYTVSGTTLTFVAAPPSGTNNIYVRFAQLLALASADSSNISYVPAAGAATDVQTRLRAYEASGGSNLVGFLQAGTGAVTRTAQAKMRDVVSVLDFGAVADYVYATNSGTDNTAAFQAAINYCQTNKKALYIPGGNYRIGSALNITDTLTIIGDGRISSRLWCTNSSANGIVVGNNVSHLRFQGFNVVYHTKGAGNCVQIGENAANLHFSDFYVDNGNYGIYVPSRAYLQTYDEVVMARCTKGAFIIGQAGGGGSTIRFNECYALGNAYGMEVQFSSEATFINCATDFTDDISELGIRAYNCASVVVINHHAEGISAPTGFGSGNIAAAIRLDECQSLIVDGLYYDLDGSSGPVVYAISSQITSISSVLNVRGVTKGSYISASNRRIETNATSGGQHYLIETPGDWGAAVGYINVGGSAVRRMNFDSDGNLQIIGSDYWSTITRATGVQTGKLYSPSDNQVRLSSLPNSGYVILECKDGSGNSKTLGFNSDAFAVAASGLDNTIKLGDASYRWSTVYAGTGTINTSDEREKQQVLPVDAAVLRAWGRVQYCQFKFSDAVKQKGDGARWHFGLIAQRVKEAFESEGLDAFAYGLLCYDQWTALPEIVNDDGVVVQEARGAGSRYGIRYEEALALECAYLRSRLSA